jgi:hypothetical protein
MEDKAGVHVPCKEKVRKKTKNKQERGREGN